MLALDGAVPVVDAAGVDAGVEVVHGGDSSMGRSGKTTTPWHGLSSSMSVPLSISSCCFSASMSWCISILVRFSASS
eukprot:6616026-Pyramimonas_sp.AAC.1